MTITTSIPPKEITEDIDSGIQYASFGYYDGIKMAKENNWKQTTSMGDLNKMGYFIVCCGDVMIRVMGADYSDIPRRRI